MSSLRQELSARLPEALDYRTIEALSLECREKLDRYRPSNLAACTRIEGITPEALLTLMRYVKREETAASSQPSSL